MPEVLVPVVRADAGTALDVRADVDPAVWDEMVRTLGGSLFQSHAWMRYRCLHGANEPRYFLWRDAEGRPVAAAAGILKPGDASWAARVAQRLSFETGPAQTDGGVDCLGDISRWAMDATGSGELELGSYDMRAPWSGADDDLCETLERTEFLLDLVAPDEQLKKMRKGTRYSVKKARKAGLTVRDATSEADVLAFCGLYRETVTRLAATKSAALDLPAVERQARSLRFLIEEGRGRLILAETEGRPLAGCFFGTFGDEAYYLLNGNTEEGRSCGAVALALVEAMGILSASGITRLNLGGVLSAAEASDHPDHGLWAFKLGLGATPRACRSGRLVLRPVRAHILHSLTRARRQLRRWK